MRTVQYVSTRGQAPELGFEDVLLAGLAGDGGLYVPAQWPQRVTADWRALRGRPYAAVAADLLAPFVGTGPLAQALPRLVGDAYDGFGHPAVTPLVQLDHRLWLLELFHGPTLAFKDVALQLLGRLFDDALGRRGERITIVGATSGDTGSAAIEACRDRDAIEIFILFPKGRTSEVQRRQMTTVPSANVHCIAVEGTFDDCQDLVKAMFADAALRRALSLSAVNSINWARIMAQTVYYAAAAVALGGPEQPVAFVVPTGNFGNIYAGYAARCMGLPVERLIVGTNRNDILARFFASGTLATAGVEPTLSPSMDIQISSNFERYLFDLFGRDAGRLADFMQVFRRDGRMEVGPDQMAQARALFGAHRVDDETTLATMARVHARTGQVIDPHTAIGVATAEAALDDGSVSPDVPVIALGCAHPAKFPEAVAKATGVRPTLPTRLADLYDRSERVTTLANDYGVVSRFVHHTVHDRRGAAARDSA